MNNVQYIHICIYIYIYLVGEWGGERCYIIYIYIHILLAGERGGGRCYIYIYIYMWKALGSNRGGYMHKLLIAIVVYTIEIHVLYI